MTSLELLKGYWQVPLSARARGIAPGGLLSYAVLPFGLLNAPATVQHLINKL